MLSPEDASNPEQKKSKAIPLFRCRSKRIGMSQLARSAFRTEKSADSEKRPGASITAATLSFIGRIFSAATSVHPGTGTLPVESDATPITVQTEVNIVIAAMFAVWFIEKV